MSKPIFALVMSVALVASAFAGEAEDRGRALLEQHQKAIVTVQLVIKQKMSFGGMGSQDDESRSEIIGTMISPEGLTVVSLTETDPSAMMSNFMPDEMSDNLKIESTIASVKLLLDDGKELESGVVLRDKDLDLAFVRPKTKPEAALPFVDLAQNGTAQVLDVYVALSRMGKVGNRAPGASLGHIHAVATKPRTLYFPDGGGAMGGTGSPALSLDGKVLGVIVMRTMAGGGGGSMFDMMGAERNISAVIMPAGDISEAASQAPPFGQEPKEETMVEEKKSEAAAACDGEATTKLAEPEQ